MDTTTRSFIGKDSYTGKHTMAFNPKVFRVAVYTAGELAAMDLGSFFQSFGSVGGVEHFIRTRYVPDADGNLFCYDADGALKIVHPAGRKLRILTGK